ncbi:Phosphatidylinositol-4-phosphate 5-kinase [Podochytrium sp. JEL0797]|nr:Phosphatidylinositol-4-phosphate 5-kinase [Podochytrium sp. JEL0797]
MPVAEPRSANEPSSSSAPLPPMHAKDPKDPQPLPVTSFNSADENVTDENPPVLLPLPLCVSPTTREEPLYYAEPASTVSIPARKESLEILVQHRLEIDTKANTTINASSTAFKLAKDEIFSSPPPPPPSSSPFILERKTTKTPPARSTYNVWEANNEGEIVQEQVTVNIPTRRFTNNSHTANHEYGLSPVSLKRNGRPGSYHVEFGTPIKEGHANYLLMYDMLTGIRVSVSRCHAKPNRVRLEEEDFKAAHKLAFDVTGNELLPKATYDFKFKDYAPWVFRQIRQVFMVDAPEYLLSLTGKYVLSELGSPGKSGSFFYFSQDYRFIIKTISKTEHKFFRRILKGYYEHVQANPDTLLCRIFGLHRVKIPGGQKIRFVVMGNVFPANKDIHETFDLKGSTVGRVVRAEDIQPHSTLKDLNFMQMQKTIHLGPHKKEMFLRQLEKDALFLQIHHVMDYSLLLGIHNLETGNRQNIRETTLAAFEPSPETLVRRQQQQDHAAPRAPSLERNVPSGTTLHRTRSRSLSLGRHHTRRASALEAQENVVVEPTRAILPDDSPPERQFFQFYNEMGGVLAENAAGEEGEEVYYMGIIDIFTEYNTVKKVEHFFKSLMGNGRKISAVNSTAYGKRFVSFIEKACD